MDYKLVSFFPGGKKKKSLAAFASNFVPNIRPVCFTQTLNT